MGPVKLNHWLMFGKVPPPCSINIYAVRIKTLYLPNRFSMAANRAALISSLDFALDPPPNVFEISRYDNSEQVVIAENGAGSGFGAGNWTRIDWTFEDSGQFWICLSTWDADTEEDAMDEAAADPASPGDSGCRGSYPWTPLNPG